MVGVREPSFEKQLILPRIFMDYSCIDQCLILWDAVAPLGTVWSQGYRERRGEGGGGKGRRFGGGGGLRECDEGSVVERGEGTEGQKGERPGGRRAWLAGRLIYKDIPIIGIKLVYLRMPSSRALNVCFCQTPLYRDTPT